MNAPTSAAPADFDWQRSHTLAVRAAFPKLDEGAVRRALIVAIARARTPGEAASAVHAAAVELKLDLRQRHEITVLIADLTSRQRREGP